MKYSALSDDYLFEPIIVDTIGAIGIDSLKLINKIGHRMYPTTGDKLVKSQLKPRLSIAIQKATF